MSWPGVISYSDKEVTRAFFISKLHKNAFSNPDNEIYFKNCTFTRVDMKNIKVGDQIVKFINCLFKDVDFSGFEGANTEFIGCYFRGLRDDYRTNVKSYSSCVFEDFIGGGCPKCHQRGIFIKMALCCPIHGMYAGC